MQPAHHKSKFRPSLRSLIRELESGNVKMPDNNLAPFLRTFDLFIATILLVPSLVLVFPVVAGLIFFTSGGPVFFVQKRTGRNGHTFSCIKFRTMHTSVDAEVSQATSDDPRITPLGYILRVLHIDELPQLLNVIMGEMSLVGPRPHMLYHTEKFSKILPFYSHRLTVAPGLTGLAQVNGYLGELRYPDDLRRRVILDIFYIRNRTAAMQAAILYQTITSVTGKFIRMVCYQGDLLPRIKKVILRTDPS